VQGELAEDLLTSSIITAPEILGFTPTPWQLVEDGSATVIEPNEINDGRDSIHLQMPGQITVSDPDVLGLPNSERLTLTFHRTCQLFIQGGAKERLS